MKKYTSTIMAIVIIIGLMLFMFFVTPSIGKPVTIGLFFGLLFGCVVMISYALLGHIKTSRRRLVWSFIIAFYSTYITALSSLNGLALANVSIATFVLIATLFLIERSNV